MTPPVAGADLRAASVASCFRGALPNTLLLIKLDFTTATTAASGLACSLLGTSHFVVCVLVINEFECKRLLRSAEAKMSADLRSHWLKFSKRSGKKTGDEMCLFQPMGLQPMGLSRRSRIVVEAQSSRDRDEESRGRDVAELKSSQGRAEVESGSS